MTLSRVAGGSFQQRQPVLQNVVDLCQQPVMVNRAAMAAIGALGSLMLLTPICYSKLPKSLKGGMLAGATVNFVALGVLAVAAIEGEQIWATTRKAQKEIDVKQSLDNAVQLRILEKEAEKLQQAVEWLKTLPEQERLFFAQKYNLLGMIQPVQMQAVVEQPQLSQQTIETHTIPLNPQMSIEQLVSAYAEEESAIDDSWLDQSFIDESKAVFGAKGSGKSTYLRAEAAYFKTGHPDGILWIGDIHFDEDDTECSWLNGVSMQDQLKNFVADNPEKVYQFFKLFGKEMKRRVDNKLKNEPPMKLICDEFTGFMDSLTEEQRYIVLKTIEHSEFQCRKFNKGGGITIGLHNLKKGDGKTGSGLDSSVLANLHILGMGAALCDPNIKLPADFDIKKLEPQRQELQESVKPGEGRACILRRLGDSPIAVILPNLSGDVAAMKFDSGPVVPVQAIDVESEPVQDPWSDAPVENPMLTLKEWFLSQSKEPTDADLALKFQELVGRECNARGLPTLRDILRG